jgi:hypothetical protein
MKATFARLARAAPWATVVLLLASPGQAAPLLPGTTVPLTVADILADPVSDANVEDFIVQGFITPDYTGSLTAAVVRNAGGTLDFYYQITNDAGSTDALIRNINAAFAIVAPPKVFITEVFYRTDADGLTMFSDGDAGATPESADRSFNARNVGFTFLPGNVIDPGETSRILVIRTDATAFTNGVSGITNDPANFPEFVGTFQPAAAAVPEPTSLLLLSSAFTAAGFLARHRARKRKPTGA